jgi:TRAP-type C4-dicarboxylate transport system permease small subunit
MDSIISLVALISVVLFFISLGTDMFDGLLMDLLPEKFREKLRWVLGIIALISTTAYIIVSLKN